MAQSHPRFDDVLGAIQREIRTTKQLHTLFAFAEFVYENLVEDFNLDFLKEQTERQFEDSQRADFAEVIAKWGKRLGKSDVTVVDAQGLAARRVRLVMLFLELEQALAEMIELKTELGIKGKSVV